MIGPEGEVLLAGSRHRNGTLSARRRGYSEERQQQSGEGCPAQSASDPKCVSRHGYGFVDTSSTYISSQAPELVSLRINELRHNLATSAEWMDFNCLSIRPSAGIMCILAQ